MTEQIDSYLRVIKIIELVVAIRNKPSNRYGTILCELRKGAHVLSLEEMRKGAHVLSLEVRKGAHVLSLEEMRKGAHVLSLEEMSNRNGMNKKESKEKELKEKETVWIRINLGWLCTKSIDNYDCIETVSIDQARESWRQEEIKRQRFASAVVSSIIKYYPLPKAKRFIRSLCKHADKFYPSKPMINIERKGLEDIMLSLGGDHPKSKEEIFSIIKIAAAEQSDPQQAVLLITNEIERVVQTRPTTWVVDNMNVLMTEGVVMRNDKFIMSAASGNVELFESYLDQGQEMIALHSELMYTALHAAADFGKYLIVEAIIRRGSSLDMLDPRLGQTALHFAAWAGRVEVVKRLLTAGGPIYSRKKSIIGYVGGANRKIPNKKGLLAYQCAHIQGHIECRDRLNSHPLPVADLTATRITTNTITVSWSPPPQLSLQHSNSNSSIHSFPAILEYYVECYPQDDDLPTDYISEKRFQGDDMQQQQQPLECMFTNLLPDVVYVIRAKCFSLAGWSDFCKPIQPTTVSYVPDIPDPLQICKVTTNGVLLQWHPPLRTNGRKVDYYQLEVIDARSAGSVEVIQQEEELLSRAAVMGGDKVCSEGDDDDDDGGASVREIAVSQLTTTTISQDQQSKSAIIAKSRKLKRLKIQSSQGGLSKYHRLVLHKNTRILYKYLTGLEPHRPYECRVRAHNDLGYSPWSGWTGPVSPGPGVIVSQFELDNFRCTLTWFVPLLSAGRQVEAYELQLCCLKGPETKAIQVADGRKSKKNNNDDENDEDEDDVEDHHDDDRYRDEEEEDEYANHYGDDTNEFFTIRNDLISNTYTLSNLKPGSRYKARVRAKIREYGKWNPWDRSSVVSDVFSMPAAPPDPPFHVRVAVSTTERKSRGDAAIDTDASGIVMGMRNALSKTPKGMLGTDQMESSMHIQHADLHDHSLIDDADTHHHQTHHHHHLSSMELTIEESMQLTSSSINLAPTISEVKARNNDIDIIGDGTALDGANSRDLLEIKHNSITISWENGQSNGRPIEEFVIQIAEINVFDIRDVVYAQGAYHFDVGDEIMTLPTHNTANRNNSALKKKTATVGDGSDVVVAWKDVLQLNTTQGKEVNHHHDDDNSHNDDGNGHNDDGNGHNDDGNGHNDDHDGHDGHGHDDNHVKHDQKQQFKGRFIGGKTFKVLGLLPGSTYIFRLKHRNDCGWSGYSPSSRMISTYPTVPPGRPIIFAVRNTFAAAKWCEIQQERLGLTNLIYEVQLGIFDPPEEEEVNRHHDHDRNHDHHHHDDHRNHHHPYPVTATVPATVDTRFDQVSWETIRVKYFYGDKDETLQAIYRDNDLLDHHPHTSHQYRHHRHHHQVVDGSDGGHTLDSLSSEYTALHSNAKSYISDEGVSLRVVHVLLQQLLTGVTYVIRVRVRTVIGWSPWSVPSEPFRLRQMYDDDFW